MSELHLGVIVALVTVAVLLTGTPIAFGLGIVAMGFLVWFEGLHALGFVPDILYGSLDSFALLSIPMFILMGGAIASSRAGADLYEALDRWLHRVPGGLLASNLGACAIFAALCGSSPATCAAIGKMGVPEMRKRGYPADVATGSICAGGTLGILIPPSITLIVYGIATETSIGRLFAAGFLPGFMLTALFIAWGIFATWRRGRDLAATEVRYSLRQKLEVLPKVVPFLLIIVGVLYVLYGGIATPSEAAGVGALLCLVLVMAVYRLWRGADLWQIFRAAMRRSVMIMMIIAAADLFSYMMSTLFITQALAMQIAALEVNRWLVMLWINVFLLVAGCFLPPVAIILMTAPTLLPIVEGLGFDAIWFGIILTINMEIGLITPPVGLNLYVINGIAPDVPLQTILWGALALRAVHGPRHRAPVPVPADRAVAARRPHGPDVLSVVSTPAFALILAHAKTGGQVVRCALAFCADHCDASSEGLLLSSDCFRTDGVYSLEAWRPWARTSTPCTVSGTRMCGSGWRRATMCPGSRQAPTRSTSLIEKLKWSSPNSSKPTGFWNPVSRATFPSP